MTPSEEYADNTTRQARTFWPGENLAEITMPRDVFNNHIRLAYLEGASKAIAEINAMTPIRSVAAVAPGWVTP